MSVNDYDIELYEAIRTIVLENELDEKSDAYGIAMQVVHREHDSLSLKQRYLYETHVETLLKKYPAN